MAEPFASLPMYDAPELREATDLWWAGLAGHFRGAGVTGVPDRLSRPGEGAEYWLSPDMLFSQTCGYPLVTALAGRVRIVATPCYDAPGCSGPRYRGVIIVNAESPARNIVELRGKRCAVNNADSWSGHHALRVALAALAGDRPVFGEVLVSGGHAASLAMVAGGAAEVAAIDCVTYALMEGYAPDLVSRVRVIGRTPLAPGLPCITRGQASDGQVRRLREGFTAALADPALGEPRRALRIAGAKVLDEADYARLRRLSDGAGPPLLI